MPVQPGFVIFDYGNVLSQPQNRAEIAAMAAVFNVPVARFQDAYWPDRAAFDRATMTPEFYWTKLAERLSRTLSDAGCERLIELDNLSWANPDLAMVEWARELRGAGVKTAILSNMPVTLRRHLDRFCPWLPEFDYGCFSCDVGLVKPAPEIFLQCLAGLGAAVAETLFLDDREENVVAARGLGINAIHFTTPAQAQLEISRQYRLPFPIRSSGDGRTRAQA